jgi:hypothetical protein
VHQFIFVFKNTYLPGGETHFGFLVEIPPIKSSVVIGLVGEFLVGVTEGRKVGAS